VWPGQDTCDNVIWKLVLPMDNPFSWDALTRTPAPEEIFSLPAMIFFVVFVIGFVVSAYLANQGARRIASHPVTRRGIQHLAGIAVYIFGAGLFFFGVRSLNINPFSFGSPIWMWLSLLALIIFAIYAYRYWTVTYPARLEAFAQQQLKQQYLKPAKGAAAKSAARAAPKPAPRAAKTATTRQSPNPPKK
jgi:hypothetical protein